jgi:hypothetical protein
MSKVGIARVVVLGMVLFSISACKQVDDQPKEDIYPWQITIQPDGKLRVFGIILNETSLTDAAALLNRDYKIGLFETSNQPMSLEAYFNEVTMGGISGKFVMTLEATQDELAELLQNAVKRKVLESGAKRYTLKAETSAVLAQKRITSLSYIPYINLDEEIIMKRFGEPAERIVVDQKRQHLLYPELGLDLLLDEEGKELLQYVAPVKFEQLRQPLLEKYGR